MNILNFSEFDGQIDLALEPAIAAVNEHSTALGRSLLRAMTNARQSRRFEAAVNAGRDCSNLSPEHENIILKQINAEFQELDFMIFFEYVRLLRACTLSAGGTVSKIIRDCYNRTLFTERVSLAIRTGYAQTH